MFLLITNTGIAVDTCHIVVSDYRLD